ncbi:S-adenosyl-L-methionine-dependent methyltransferase [Entophlyctis helioformis]|nr:S-adenosyl-L-methionine-dependent methyltransferase [Entophlyctis helioformis]
MIKLRQLESELSKVAKFKEPKIQLEQYPTTAHLAASMFYTAATVYDDFPDTCTTTVVDLGVGTGMLSAAAALLGAEVTGVDIDPDALAQAVENFEELGVDEQVDLVLADVQSDAVGRMKADVVVLNPPFGTKNNAGLDMRFLKAAAGIAQRSIYSLHKSSTRDFVLKKAESWGLKGEVVAELRYNLDASYKFHKKKSVDIQVDLLRFEVQ